MVKKNTTRSDEEFESHYIKIMSLLDLIVNDSDPTSNMDLINGMRNMVSQSYVNHEVSKMRLLKKEVDVWFRETLSDDQKNTLSSLFNGKFLAESPSRILKAVTKRQKILNVDEYRIVSERVDEIYQKPDKAIEVAQLNKLLRDFEKS